MNQINDGKSCCLPFWNQCGLNRCNPFNLIFTTKTTSATKNRLFFVAV
ncbi:MAG: hypothetical protein LBL62_06305 [Planctomycetaceae bacterium]|nr:hypothetical protein [Planctomycetaceae bacterium]